MSQIKKNQEDIVNQDLSEFLQVYLKSLLIYNPHSTSLLLPPSGPQDKASIENVFNLLNEIIDSGDNQIESKIRQSPTFSKLKPIFDTICQEQKAPQLLQESLNQQTSLLSTLTNLKLTVTQPEGFQQITQTRKFCWGFMGNNS